MEQPINMLAEYPRLPRLTMAQCVKIFKLANIGPSVIAEWTKYSRVIVTHWMKGNTKGVKTSTEESVSALAYRVLRALRHNLYPMKSRQVADVLRPLRDDLYGQSLAEYAPEDLLPKAWLVTFNPTREHDAA